MSAAVIVFPGSNCDRDCKVAVERSTGEKVEMVWHGETELPKGLDLIVLPGGFSYGDYLRCGAMAAQSPVMQAVAASPTSLLFGVVQVVKAKPPSSFMKSPRESAAASALHMMISDMIIVLLRPSVISETFRLTFTLKGAVMYGFGLAPLAAELFWRPVPLLQLIM